LTATPYANILEKNANYHEVKFLEASKEYCGSDKFIKKDKYLVKKCDKNFINYKYDEFILNVILVWLFKTAFLLIKKPDIKSTELLLNVEFSKKQHIKLSNLITNIIKDMYPFINSLAFDDY